MSMWGRPNRTSLQNITLKILSFRSFRVLLQGQMICTSEPAFLFSYNDSPAWLKTVAIAGEIIDEGDCFIPINNIGIRNDASYL